MLVDKLIGHAVAATARLESVIANLGQLASVMQPAKMEPFRLQDAVHTALRQLGREWQWATTNASARVTIEQQVTRDLTLTYSSNAASDQQQLIQVEYHVKRDLSVVFLRDVNGTYGLDIKFVRHFH